MKEFNNLHSGQSDSQSATFPPCLWKDPKWSNKKNDNKFEFFLFEGFHLCQYFK